MSEIVGGTPFCGICGPECDLSRHRKLEPNQRCSVTIGGEATPIVYESAYAASVHTPPLPPIGPIDFEPNGLTHKQRRVYVSGSIPDDATATILGKPRALYRGKDGIWFCPLCEGDCIDP